jgi:hypothetical protein
LTIGTTAPIKGEEVQFHAALELSIFEFDYPENPRRDPEGRSTAYINETRDCEIAPDKVL